MKKRTIGILFGLLFAMFLVTGCGEGTAPTTGTTFIGGSSNGIEITFMENAPPLEVADNGKQPFDIILLVENIGEYDVSADNFKVELTGINQADFSKGTTDFVKIAENDFVRKRKIVGGDLIPGTTQQIQFEGLNYKLDTKGDTEFNLRLDSCYNYGTYAVSNLCYKKDIFNTKGACNANEAKIVSNSNAPVQITSLKENPATENKISFTIEISHVGTGEVFLKDSGCDDSEYGNMNKVNVMVDTGITEGSFKCTGFAQGNKIGTVNLNNGKAIITCTQEYTATGDYEKQLNIELNYEYRQTLTRTLKVTNMGE